MDRKNRSHHCEIYVNNPPECVAEKFNYYYEKEYKYLWNYLNSTADILQKCSSPEDYANFIKLFVHVHGNSEFSEFSSEMIETTLFNNSECLMNALILADSKSKNQVLKMLENPLFHQEGEVAAILEKYKVSDKYGALWEQESKGKNNRVE